jgi:hypothetical protein
MGRGASCAWVGEEEKGEEWNEEEEEEEGEGKGDV